MEAQVLVHAPGGPVHKEIRAALYGTDRKIRIVNYIYGLGGRDMSMANIRTAFAGLEKVAREGTPDDNIRFLGLRGEGGV